MCITLNEIEDQETSCHAPQCTTYCSREAGTCGGSLLPYVTTLMASHRQEVLKIRVYLGSLKYSVKELSEALEKIQLSCL